MAEEKQYNEGYRSESLVYGLYFFREAAREYLREKNNLSAVNQSDDFMDTPLAKMLGRLPCLLEKLAPEKKDDILKEVAQPIVQMLQDSSRQDFVSEKWFGSHVSTGARNNMIEVMKKGQELLGKKISIENDIAEQLQNQNQVVDTPENPDMQMVHDEIATIIGKSNNISAQEKEKMNDALQNASVITYKCNKNGIITYHFGDFDVVGTLSIGGAQRYNADGTPKYSKGGCLSAQFVAQIKSKGKWETSKGHSAKKAKEAFEKSDKKIKSLRQKLLLQEEKLAQNQAQQQMFFHQVMISLDAQFLLSDSLNPHGFLAEAVRKYDLQDAWQKAQEKVVENVFSCAPVWKTFMRKLYAPQNHQQSLLENEIEQEFQVRSDPTLLVRAGQEFYREFAKLATDEKNQLDVTKISDETLKSIFHKQMQKVVANVPVSIRKEALMQEIFRQALRRNGGSSFDGEKFQMMNRLLMMDGMKIELKPVKIQHKFQTSAARDFSEPIQVDMQQRGLVEKRHKIEAFLYHLGEYRRNNPKEKFKELNPRSPFVGLYREFTAACYGHVENAYAFSAHYREKWQQFVNDKHNLQQADNMYQMMQAMVVPGVDIDKTIEKLAEGQSLNEKKSLAQQTKHHLLYRRFAGFFGDDLATLKKVFNAPENVIDTITLHPVSDDVHKNKEHRFDMGEEYLYQKADGKVFFGAYSSGLEGHTLCMPVVCVQNEKGKFEPLMKPNMLLMTSHGTVMEPHIPGQAPGPRNFTSQLGFEAR